jgi:hypothetical protein
MNMREYFFFVICRYFSYNENAFIAIRQLSVHASRGKENIKRVNTRQINKADGEEEEEDEEKENSD